LDFDSANLFSSVYFISASSLIYLFSSFISTYSDFSDNLISIFTAYSCYFFTFSWGFLVADRFKESNDFRSKSKLMFVIGSYVDGVDLKVYNFNSTLLYTSVSYS